MALEEFRLGTTARDYTSLDAEVSRYFASHFPEINNLGDGTPGRAYIRVLQGLIDILGLYVDLEGSEGRLGSATVLENAALDAEGLGYFFPGASPEQVDLLFTSIGGPAPTGGIPIPKYSQVKAGSLFFLVLQDSLIEEGESTVETSAAEGQSVQNEVLAPLVAGTENPIFRLANLKVWQDSIELIINGETWTPLPFSERSRGDNYPSYRIINDARTGETYLWLPSTGPWRGRPLTTGASILCNYVRTQGAAGHVEVNAVTQVIGGLSQLVTATNPKRSSGGSDGPSASEIRALAPASYASSVTKASETQLVGAAKSVPGVHEAKLSFLNGFALTLRIYPKQGGEASQSLKDAVYLKVTQGGLPGAEVTVDSYFEAQPLISVNVFLLDRVLRRETVIAQVRGAIQGSLAWDQVQPGRGLARSDIDVLSEGKDDRFPFSASSKIDYVDVIQLTRIPRIVPSSVTLPSLPSVTISEQTDLADYVITVLNATQFQVAKNGVIEAVDGTIATVYTTAGGEVSFQIGQSGDTFGVPDFGATYAFSTSPWGGNLRISAEEALNLRTPSDIQVAVFYPGETPA